MRGSSTAVWQFDPPQEVLNSRLFAAGGYLVTAGLFTEETLRGLRAEADFARINSQRGYLGASDGEEGRGGAPARAYRWAPGGDLHRSLYECRQMTETLGRLCSVTVSSKGDGTFSYYEQAGDFLALHRDVLYCDIAVITALTERAGNGATGELMIYPEFIHAPLSTVRSAGRAQGRSLPLARGQTVILLGGLVPHELIPTQAGQERIVAVNCYRVHTAQAGEAAAREW